MTEIMHLGGHDEAGSLFTLAGSLTVKGGRTCETYLACSQQCDTVGDDYTVPCVLIRAMKR